VGTDYTDGESALFEAGTGDGLGQAGRQGGANLLHNQGALARPTFERREFVSSS
jgi:hypothetical protein